MTRQEVTQWASCVVPVYKYGNNKILPEALPKSNVDTSGGISLVK